MMDRQQLLTYYSEHLMKKILPFWLKNGIDKKNGGVFTCIDNKGTNLISRDKYTWSQGRFAWMMARIGDLCTRNIIQDDPTIYLNSSKKTVQFLLDNVFLDNSHCTYLMDEYGNKKLINGYSNYDVSIYSECFVALGFLEYGRVVRNEYYINKAWDLYLQTVERIKTDDYRLEPYPVPKEISIHGLPMILLNLSVEFGNAFEQVNELKFSLAKMHSGEYIDEIFGQVDRSSDLILEHIPKLNKNKSEWNNRLLCKHVAPGHTAETLWLIMMAAEQIGDVNLINKVIKILKNTFKIGWDKEYGGIFRFIGLDGNKPSGEVLGLPYETQILDTWDMKLWWVHTEFLLAVHMASLFDNNDEELVLMASAIHDYTFNIFPNKDKSIGEWIQKRDRYGNPLDKIVALPIKDPYHISRDLLILIELYSKFNI